MRARRWAVGCSKKAEALFAEIQAQSLMRPGAKESEINEAIYTLTARVYWISRYWTNASCVRCDGVRRSKIIDL
jgi:hypothetical protein